MKATLILLFLSAILSSKPVLKKLHKNKLSDSI